MEHGIKIKSVKERGNLDLLNLICELSGRVAMYNTKELHEALVEARTELESRLKPIAGGELWDELQNEINNGGSGQLLINFTKQKLSDKYILIKKSEAITGESEDVRELLQECEDYFEKRADADHNGENFVPNREMVLLGRVRSVLAFK